MHDNTVIIDCNRCALRGRACGDCVLSVIVDAPPVVELDSEELAAVELLSDAGLVPPRRRRHVVEKVPPLSRAWTR